ncbi:hypothetical protein BS17DRAFT_766766 [Gyrodon lividus]|nr:hypothetical protein BS17DRAFT_766766 [Gyrodon lividus]
MSANKRSPAHAHRNLAARFSPTDVYPTQATSTSQSATLGDSVGAGKTTPQTSTTPTKDSPTTTPTSATTPSTTIPSSSTTSTTSQSTTSSSATTLSTPLTPSILTPAPITTPSVLPTNSIKVVTGFTSASTPILSPSATPTSTSSSSVSTSAIVGGIAGTLAGIAVIGFLIMWCMRRQRNHDLDDFDANAFKRQSAILVDDPVEPSRSYNPRPPTMIERHNASPALAAQPGHGGQGFYGNHGAFGQQAPYANGEIIQHGGSPPPQAYGQPAMGYSGYNDPRQLLRQPSNAAYLSHVPTTAAPHTPLPASVDPNAHYVDLNRSSVTPYQVAQYADISRHLGSSDPNDQTTDLPVELLPSPFDDHLGTPTTASPEAHPTSASDTVACISESPAPQPQQNTVDSKQRPTSSYTVYGDGDAYDGI